MLVGRNFKYIVLLIIVMLALFLFVVIQSNSEKSSEELTKQYKSVSNQTTFSTTNDSKSIFNEFRNIAFENSNLMPDDYYIASYEDYQDVVENVSIYERYDCLPKSVSSLKDMFQEHLSNDEYFEMIICINKYKSEIVLLSVNKNKNVLKSVAEYRDNQWVISYDTY